MVSSSNGGQLRMVSSSNGGQLRTVSSSNGGQLRMVIARAETLTNTIICTRYADVDMYLLT